MPDERLFRVADAGRLTDPTVLRTETLRMLADPKARTLVTDFAAQWLQLRALDRAKPDPARFSTVDDELRDAMRTETELFLQEIVREDHSVLDLLDGAVHVRQRPARPALRDSRGRRRGVPARRSRRTAARRAAVARERPDRLVLPDAHVAGAARQVGAGEPARRTAAGAARGRPGPGSRRRRRCRRHVAGADGGTPHQPELRGLP